MAHAPKNDPLPHIVQIGVAPGSQYTNEALYALLSDNTLWKLDRAGWEPLTKPPPCNKPES